MSILKNRFIIWLENWWFYCFCNWFLLVLFISYIYLKRYHYIFSWTIEYLIHWFVEKTYIDKLFACLFLYARRIMGSPVAGGRAASSSLSGAYLQNYSS